MAKRKSRQIAHHSVAINPEPENIPEVRLLVDGVIVVNTDSMVSPNSGDDLIQSRKNKIIAKLGENAELVSIFLLGYNRLEKTKTCLESILKYTVDIDFELVLIDNGSTDGTLDYYKSVNYPRKKIIRVTKNMGIYEPTWDQFNGRYIIGIPNDIYVTKNWLRNLLTCARSDDRIGMVVPASSNVSNLQNIDLQYNSMEEMWEKAAQNNVSDPRKWHEKLRLVTSIVLYKREALEMMGKFDYGFIHDFADDDITFRIRRAGYKTILCKDSFVHHDHNYANLEDKDPVEFQHSLEAGKNDFRKKYYGIDAWDDVNNYEPVMVSLVEPQGINDRNEVMILGIDVLCGSPILEIKNKLREAEIFNPKLFAFSSDAKYWLDLKTICEGDVIVGNLDCFGGLFSGLKFDYILLGKPINSYDAPIKFLQEIFRLLKQDGHLLIKLRNTYDALTLIKALGGKIEMNKTPQFDHVAVYHMPIEELIESINIIGYIQKKIALEFLPLNGNLEKALRDVIATVNFSNDPKEAFTRAAVRDFVFDLVRK